MRIAENITSTVAKIIWRGKMSKLLPGLQKKFAKRAPSVLKSFSVKVPEVLDPELRIAVSYYRKAPLGEVDTETGVIFLNIARYTGGQNLKGKIKRIREIAHKMDDTLWHEYVHYLQLTTKLICRAGTLDMWLYKFKRIFKTKQQLYYTNSIEQQAFIEQIRYLQDKGQSKKEILTRLLTNMLAEIKTGMRIPKDDLGIIAKTLIKKDKKKFVRVMLYHYAAINPKGLSTYWGRYLATRRISKLYNELQTILSAYESFFKMMNYHAKKPKLRWFRPLI